MLKPHNVFVLLHITVYARHVCPYDRPGTLKMHSSIDSFNVYYSTINVVCVDIINNIFPSSTDDRTDDSTDNNTDNGTYDSIDDSIYDSTNDITRGSIDNSFTMTSMT